MTLTVAWHDVVLIANPVNMVYSDHSVLYYTFRLSKKRIPPLDEFVIPSPLTILRPKFIPPLSNLLFFLFPPKNSFSPTHRKNDRSLGVDNFGCESMFMAVIEI